MDFNRIISLNGMVLIHDSLFILFNKIKTEKKRKIQWKISFNFQRVFFSKKSILRFRNNEQLNNPKEFWCRRPSSSIACHGIESRWRAMPGNQAICFGSVWYEFLFLLHFAIVDFDLEQFRIECARHEENKKSLNGWE